MAERTNGRVWEAAPRKYKKTLREGRISSARPRGKMGPPYLVGRDDSARQTTFVWGAAS